MWADTALDSARKFLRIFDVCSVFWAKLALFRLRLNRYQPECSNDAGRNICRILAVSFGTIPAVPGNQRDIYESLNFDDAYGQASRKRNP
jgi:hypothetical protein